MEKVKTFSFLIFGLFLLFSFSFTKAGKNENVAGWAWSENVGWISFNSLNCDTNGDGKSDGLPPGCPPAGTPIANYGVNLDPSTKIFSGYAWSEHIGWITFNEAELSGCPSPPCRAWLDSENKVHGWAKALVDGGGWSGWIRLSDTNYGVWLDTSTSPQEFRGWAWLDMVVGWVSFNCRDRNVCSSSNYKVYLTNQPPTVSNPYETQDSCAWGKSPQVAPGLVITLHWAYSDPDGDSRSAFEIWLDDSSNFQDPKFNKIFNISSGESSQSYVLNLSDDQEGDWSNRLAWGTTYYWKVRVRDSAGNWSNWSTVDSFITPSHASPYVNFSWFPQKPVVNQVVQFTDFSECYNPLDSVIPCSSWYWTFQDGNPSFSTSQNPTTTFSSIGQKQVILRVTDSSGYSCINSKVLQTTYPLPFWKEIPPPIFFKLREFLASLILAISKIKLF